MTGELWTGLFVPQVTKLDTSGTYSWHQWVHFGVRIAVISLFIGRRSCESMFLSIWWMGIGVRIGLSVVLVVFAHTLVEHVRSGLKIGTTKPDVAPASNDTQATQRRLKKYRTEGVCAKILSIQRNRSNEEKEDSRRWAILLPVTSRDMSFAACKETITNFLDTLTRTTDETERQNLILVVGCDYEDKFYSEGRTLHLIMVEKLNAMGVQYLYCEFPKEISHSGAVCKMTNILAETVRTAYRDGVPDFYVLLGDDIVMKTNGWKQAIEEQFDEMALEFMTRQNINERFKLGCVAFMDETMIGFPTFPVIHKTHFEIFETMFPHAFINQGGDPYLFALYKRFGAARICQRAVLANTVGGGEDARYFKFGTEWKGDILEEGIIKINSYLKWILKTNIKQSFCIDTLVPSFRCDISVLSGIISVRVPTNMQTTFIVVIDNPLFNVTEKFVTELLGLVQDRPNTSLRIHIHSTNLGVSFARNTALNSADGDYLWLVDDDVVPNADILERYMTAAKRNKEAKILVGNVVLLRPRSIWQKGLQKSVSYFYDISKKMDHPPWGVTANLCVVGRRNIRFDTMYPKHGGGEDIDLCLQLIKNVEEDTLSVPTAEVTHPYWKRPYQQVQGWAIGDSLCLLRWPQKSYFTMPNVFEFVLKRVMWMLVIRFGGMDVGVGGVDVSSAFWETALLLVVAWVIQACRVWFMNNGAVPWHVCLVGASFVLWQEAVRVVCHLYRGKVHQICRRFDFLGHMGVDSLAVDKWDYFQFLVFFLVFLFCNASWVSRVHVLVMFTCLVLF